MTTDASAAQLTALVNAHAPVAPFLRKHTPEQLLALRPAATECLQTLILALRRGERHDTDDFNRYALVYACADLDYVSVESLATVVEALPELLPLPAQPDFYTRLLTHKIRYRTLLQLMRLGLVSEERAARHPYRSYALYLHPYGTLNSDRTPDAYATPYERLFAFPETVPQHLPWLFGPHAQVRHRNHNHWDGLLTRLLTEGHVTRDDLIDWTLAMTTDGSDFEVGPDAAGKDFHDNIGWFFKRLRDMRPTVAELLPRQARVFGLLASPIAAPRNVGAAFAKTLAKDAAFDASAYLRAVAAAWPTANASLAKATLVTLGYVLKAQPDTRAAVAAWTAAAGQHPEEKIRAAVAAFAEKQGFGAVAVAIPEVPRERAAGERPEDQIEKINKLLSSPDEASVRVGLRLVDSDNFSPELLEALFVITRVAPAGDVRDAAQSLLERHGSPELLAIAERRFDLHGEATEETIRKNIKKYTKDNELDALRLTRALYRMTGGGIVSLLDMVDEAEQLALVRNFVRGATFDMRGTGLTKLPKALAHFPELEVIDVRDNYLGSVPASIKVFTRLKRLLLGGNRLKSVNAKVGELTALEVLDLSDNAIAGEPSAALFAAAGLRELSLGEAFSSTGEARTLPPAFFALQRLERLSLTRGRREMVFDNFPNLKLVEGAPIVLDAHVIARAHLGSSRDLAEVFLLRHGDADDRRLALRSLYDEATGTLRLSRTRLRKLPTELAEIDPAHLVLDNAFGDSRFDHPEEGEARERYYLEATAPLAQLPGLRSLHVEGRDFPALTPLSASAELTSVSFEYAQLSPFSLGLPHPERLRELHLHDGVDRRSPEGRASFLAELALYSGLARVTTGYSVGHDEALLAEMRAVLPAGCVVGEG